MRCCANSLALPSYWRSADSRGLQFLARLAAAVSERKGTMRDEDGNPADPPGSSGGSREQGDDVPESQSAGTARRQGDAADLLTEMQQLRRRTRAARHAYWFPLILFGLLTCASLPLYAAGQRNGIVREGLPPVTFGGLPSAMGQRSLGYYWLAALLGGLLLTLVWYYTRARRVGLATPIRGFIATAALLAVLALVIPLLSQVHTPSQLSWLQHLRVLFPGDLVLRGAFPFVIIAAGLLVLAWAERSLALAVIAAVYTAAAVLASLYDIENLLFRLGLNWPDSYSILASLPNVLLPGIVLLVAGTGAFAVQRQQLTRS